MLCYVVFGTEFYPSGLFVKLHSRWNSTFHFPGKVKPRVSNFVVNPNQVFTSVLQMLSDVIRCSVSDQQQVLQRPKHELDGSLVLTVRDSADPRADNTITTSAEPQVGTTFLSLAACSSNTHWLQLWFITSSKLNMWINAQYLCKINMWL